MRIRRPLIVVFLSLAFSLPAQVERGWLDARAMSASDTVSLNGDWEFFPGVSLKPAEIRDNLDKRVYISVPTSWTNRGYPVHQLGTYRLVASVPPGRDWGIIIDDIDLSAAVWIDGVCKYRAGRPEDLSFTAMPERHLRVLSFADSDGSVEIVIQVSNPLYVIGGIVRTITFGELQPVLSSYTGKIAVDFVVFGAVTIMALYHLILFLFARKDSSYLWLAVAAFAIDARVFLTGNKLFYALFEGVPWVVSFRLEMLTLCALFPFLVFFYRLYQDSYPRFVVWAAGIGAAAYAIALVALPMQLASFTLIVFELFLVCMILVNLGFLVLCAIRREPDVVTILFGVLVLSLCICNDILTGNSVIHTPFLTPLGLMLFFLFQSFVLSKRFSRSLDATENMTIDLARKSRAFERFVPKEFLTHLGRPNIEDVRLGDQTACDMSIMFTDIRDFTALSETMTSDETFRFLNSYLAINVPCVTDNGGFVDKFIGDAIMAIFPFGPEDAARSAIQMQRNIVEYNENRSRSGYAPISIGIGLHYGSLIMGTIGQENRMETTVISDVVNAASRLEALTRFYRCQILASREFISHLPDPAAFRYRHIDIVRVKGKKDPLYIFEVLDGLPEEEMRRRLEAERSFNEALALFRAKKVAEAHEAFVEMHAKWPNDHPVDVYLERCRRLMADGVPDRWDGIIDLDFK